MARWLRNTSCPACGSRDNRAEYDDGSHWCWGCRDYGDPTISPLVMEARRGNDSCASHRNLPDDLTTHFGNDAVTWLTKYGMGIETLIKNGVRYSPSRNQIIFTWPDLDVWQARNLNREAKSKYFTSGNHDRDLPLYRAFLGYYDYPMGVVLVEDCVSAIKIASATPFNGLRFDAMPLLGAHLPGGKLAALNRLYSNMIVWLDHDKGQAAQAIAKRASMLGMQSKVVMTELDPKEYSYEELREKLL